MIPTFYEDAKGTHDLHQWIIETSYNYIRGRTLVAGPNLDCFASLMVERHIPIHLSEVTVDQRDYLRNKYSKIESVREVHSIDFGSKTFKTDFVYLFEAFNTVILLYPIKNDPIVQNAARLLTRGGTLILNVPSFTSCYYGLQLSSEDWKNIDINPVKHFLAAFEVLKLRHYRFNLIYTQVVAIASKLT